MAFDAQYLYFQLYAPSNISLTPPLVSPLTKESCRLAYWTAIP